MQNTDSNSAFRRTSFISKTRARPVGPQRIVSDPSSNGKKDCRGIPTSDTSDPPPQGDHHRGLGTTSPVPLIGVSFDPPFKGVHSPQAFGHTLCNNPRSHDSCESSYLHTHLRRNAFFLSDFVGVSVIYNQLHCQYLCSWTFKLPIALFVTTYRLSAIRFACGCCHNVFESRFRDYRTES